jgi:hypothetical protein
VTELAPIDTRVSTAGFDPGAAGVTPPSNPERRGVFLADVVVELGLADQATIDQALQIAQETEKSLERYLLEAGILDEDGLSLAIAERNGLDRVDLDEFEIDMEAARMVTRSAAQRYSAVPVAFASDGALIVAVQDPFDTLGISDIEVMTRSDVRPAIATASAIEALVERLPEQPVQSPAVQEPAPEEAEAEPAPDPIENGALPTGLGDHDPIMVEASEPEHPPEPEPELEPELQPEHDLEPEVEPELHPEPEHDLEPEVEPEPVPEPMPELVQFPAPEPEPGLEIVSEPMPELVQFPEPTSAPEPEPVANVDVGSAAGGLTDIESELGSLQETARRADELATTVERRITELKRGDDRSERLEADLLAAQRRVEELEAQVSGVDTLAEELRATTAKLEEVNRVLEGSVR